jgi:outer membrane lipopolysaccharide assembly protein LptE/RlpB
MTARGSRLATCGSARGLLAFIAALATLLSAGCGYTLAGRGSFLPDTVKTIGVPDFVNHTPYYDVGQTLSQRVRTEFIGRGKYKVLPQATGVDAVLKAQINNISLAPSAFNSSQQATRYAITVTLSIQVVQASDDKVLWQNQNQVFREEYQLASGGGVLDPAAFFGQSSNAIDRMATDFARSVVSAILEAF